MKSKVKLLITLITFCIYNTYGQITTTIDEVYVNGQTSVTNCGTIDFETTENNTLTFYYTLTKTSSSSGEGYLKIRLKYNSSSNGGERASQYITANLWNNNEYVHSIPTNIDASEVQVNGSSIYLEFTEASSPNTFHNSCEHPITKTPTPTFELANDSYSIPCGSTANYTFTVNNVYNSPGTLSYSWNVGNGWKRNGFAVSGTINTTTNSITLTPYSSIILPSNVSVTTTLDGESYPTKTATVTRSAIPQNITGISGVSTLCSGNTNYTLSGTTGQTVTWSLSNTSIATLSNATNTGVTLTQTGSGEVTLTATISNGCGQSYTRTKDLFAGGPPAFAVSRGTAQSEYCDIKYHYIPFIISNKSPFLHYTVNVIGMPSTTVSSYTNDGFILKFNKNYSGWIDFIVSASNSCGSIGAYREEYIGTCSSLNSFSMQKTSTSKPISVFKAYPNPSNNVVYLDVVDVNNTPKKNAQIKASLYDMMGLEKEKVQIKHNKATINVATLPKGLYVLRVTINDDIETHLISVK